MNWKNEDGKIRFMTDDGWYHFDFMTIMWIGLFFVLVCMGILLLALSYDVFTGGKVMQKVSAEKYSYNMTEDELKESRLLEVCIQLHIEAPACSMIWGGLDTSNGEPVK